MCCARSGTSRASSTPTASPADPPAESALVHWRVCRVGACAGSYEVRRRAHPRQRQGQTARQPRRRCLVHSVDVVATEDIDGPPELLEESRPTFPVARPSFLAMELLA